MPTLPAYAAVTTKARRQGALKVERPAVLVGIALLRGFPEMLCPSSMLRGPLPVLFPGKGGGLLP